MNFKHKYDLVAAETARVTGDIGPAMENYEQAIKGARDNGFIHEEALANELYARFWQKRGNDRVAANVHARGAQSFTISGGQVPRSATLIALSAMV